MLYPKDELRRTNRSQHKKPLTATFFSANYPFSNMLYVLIGGLEHVYFSIYGEYVGIATPTDFHIFSEGSKPPTRCVIVMMFDCLIVSLF
jgi:hypothetical protein